MSSELEKDLNDEVYEDSFYDNEEELAEDELLVDGDKERESDLDEEDDDLDDEADAASDDDEPDLSETKIAMSFACDDCDYRWDDVVIRAADDIQSDDEISAICPMCGSSNVTQI